MENKDYDVLVVGGGVAGVSAALSAARAGLATALVEKTVMWGGMATTGLVPIYMPLCDGKGRQVTYGISEELLHASIKYGYGDIPEAWSGKKTETVEMASDEITTGSGMHRRYQTRFNPAAFLFGIDELLEQTAADLWLDTLACLPVMTGSAVTGVEVENKSGRIRLNAKCVIDATGDADIAARAGAPCRLRGSLPCMLYYSASLDKAKKAAEKGSLANLITWEGVGANEMQKGYEGNAPAATGVDGKGLSAYLMESRRQARLQMAEKQAALGAEGRSDYYVTSLPGMHQIRMTRAIDGEETVVDECNRHVASSVGMIADCRKTDAVWEVPYGSLLPRKVDNLLVVGRCQAAEDYAWQVTRLIQSAALTGEVAGIAARLAVQAQSSPNRLDVADVQTAVTKNGIPLHM